MNELDTEQNWEALLSLREQQLLAIARVLLAAPRFVFMDRVGTTLGADELAQVLKMLSERSITYIAVGENISADFYDATLACHSDGTWAWTENQS